jgi:hypothetical protein
MKYCKSGLLEGLGIAAAVAFMVGFAPDRGRSRRRKLSWKPFLRICRKQRGGARGFNLQDR